jgi:hypothetical protein
MTEQRPTVGGSPETGSDARSEMARACGNEIRITVPTADLTAARERTTPRRALKRS